MLIDFRRAAFWALCAIVPCITFSNSLFEISSSIFIGLSFVVFFTEKRFQIIKSPFLILLLIYLLMNFLSLTKTSDMGASWRGIFKVLEGLAICFFTATIVDSEEKLKKIFQWFLVVALIIALDALIQGVIGFDLLRKRPMTPYIGELQRLTGPFRHANDFSAYLTIILFLFVGALHRGREFFSWRSYIFYAAGFLVVLASFLGTYSRGAWVAAAITFCLYVLFERSRILIGMLVLLGLWAFFLSPLTLRERALSLLDPQNNTIVERRELWGESLRMVRQSPWFGLGVNTYAKNERLFKEEGSKIDFQYAHNGYLQMAAEIGWLGLGSFLAALLYFWVTAARTFLRSKRLFLRTAGVSLLFGILSFMIHSASDTNLQSLLLVNTLWLAIGLAWSAARLAEKL
jgi:O-antigen ligase